MKSDFSDWLVASDIDGTLNNKLRYLPKRNYDAICRFVNDLHGHFTLASGRGVESMRPHYEKLHLNTPAVIINGAGIYDYRKEELLYFNPLKEHGKEVLSMIMKRFPLCEIEIVTPEINYFVRDRFFAHFMLQGDPLPHKMYRKLNNVPFGRWGKVIIISPIFMHKRIMKYVKSLNIDDLTFMESSIVSFEMLEKDTDKGTALMKVADILGIEHTNTAGIGDYFNDYEMLKKVGVSACCAQAPKGLKKIADFVTCHCNKGAVADLLEHIEKLQIQKEENNYG